VRVAFIAWIGYHRRTELLARHLGAELHFIQFGQSDRPLQAPIKYPVQAIQTWRVLLRERPEVVVVQNPPIFCALTVYLYARWGNANYAIDSHSGAFLSPRWRWSLGLHRFVSRHALVTIVHNDSQANIVKRWTCPYCVIAFVPGDYPVGVPFPATGQFRVGVISAFAGDEPLDVVFQAAALLPEATFYVTGNPQGARQGLLETKPANCVLTGYLPYEQYIGLLRGMDAIMDLTLRDHTLLMGAFEAVSLEVPLITSDWPTLRDYFTLGTVHVANSVQGICEGVRRARCDQAELRRQMLVLHGQLEAEWERKLVELRRLTLGAFGGAE